MGSETGRRKLEIDDDEIDDLEDVDDSGDDDEDDDKLSASDDFSDDDSDNIGDASVEINVEQLIAELEGSSDMCSARKKEIRRRLEELAEDKSFEDTYAIDFDDRKK